MSDRWQKIEELFEVAVELSADERGAYLERECGGDAGLRREIEQLISADQSADEFIEEPILGSNTLANFLDEKVGDIESSVPPNFLGRRIGAYRLIRELGRGGMGAVFLAQRDDAEFKKAVAIKLIKRGMDTDFVLNRFRNERQILATLDHPFIARLLDGGTTDDGLPYFVMEYVEGSPIHQYCDENRLSIRERLQLFQKVCSAANYAHQNLIIHRDLKPGNILVTRDNSPKLLDFGIAKILDPALASDTLAPTLTGMRLMTPEYASPEQIRGEKLTPASDIYSLGVLLYELLTGKRPYRFSSRAPHDIARIICEEKPEHPAAVLNDENFPNVSDSEKAGNTLEKLSRNRRTTPENLLAELSGDLKNILLKALRKSPENRYRSAEDLADDIGAYLDGQPVSAPDLEITEIDEFEDSLPASESVAVLPFRMLRWKSGQNGDPDSGDFLSIGLADALISRLSGLKKISVRPTSAVVKYASEDAMRENAGRDLRVSHILDGRIQHIGSRVRVTAQLVHLHNNETIWAGQFDENTDDILILQDSISAQVADALIHQLTGEEREKIGRRGTNNAKAYECYLRGRFYWHSYEVEGLAKALVCFYEAIAHDPDFALAYTGVADYFNFLSVFGLMSPEESFPAAKEAAQKAIELDDTSPEAYTSLAVAVLGYDWNFAEAGRLLKKSLELNPNYGEAHIWYAHLLGLQNKHEESLREMNRAERLNTVSASLLVNYAIRLRDARKFDEALVKIRQAQTISPGYNIGSQAYCWVVDYVDVGAEAEEVSRRAYEINEDQNLPAYAYGYILAANGKRREARLIAEKLEERKRKTYVPSTNLALIHVALGEYDTAFRWLDKAFAERDFWAIWMTVDPRYDVLKKDARFNLYAERIRPIDDDDELHQSYIPTKILAVEEIEKTEVLPERSNDEKEFAGAEISSENKNSHKFIYASIAAVFLIGLIWLGFRYEYVSFSITRTPPVEKAQIQTPDSSAKTLVVLPFATDEDAENEESLADGLADSINKKLGEVRQISVRTAKDAVDDAKTVQQIGAEFGANYILRGRLNKTSDRIQVTAELFNASQEKAVWLETFDEAITDFPNLQAEIAEKILKVMTVELSIAERRRINKTYTTDSEAYQLYLVGRYQMRDRKPDDLEKAVNTFSKALEKDSNFALAYAGLSDAYSLLNLYKIPPPADGYEKAKTNIETALRLDPNLAEAHTSLAYLLFYGERDFAGSERHFRRAVELNPSYPTAYHWFALMLSATGRHDEAVENIKTAQILEPRSRIIPAAAGMVYFYARRFDDAIAVAEKSLETDIGFIPAYKALRLNHGAQGNFEKAWEAYRNERNYSGNPAEDDPEWLMIAAQVQAAGNRREEALKSIERSIAAPAVSQQPKAYAFEIAAVFGLLGEVDKTLEWLKKADNAGVVGVVWAKVDPRFEKVKDDERFKNFAAGLSK